MAWRLPRRRSGGVALVKPLTDPVEVPWQERINTFDRVIRDIGQDPARIILRVEAVQFHGFCQRVDRRGALPAGVRPGVPPAVFGTPDWSLRDDGGGVKPVPTGMV